MKKSHTTPYHPEGDGMVERFNRSLLQLLRTYVEKREEWEKYLPLALFAYRTAVHSSTGVTPFMLMYGREPSSGICTSPMGHEVNEFTAVLQSKLAKLQDLVETHNAEAASRQKSHYDKTSSERHFIAGDIVWLSIPTAGKLDPRWDGRWHINSVKSPLTVEITDGEKTKTVHVNRVRHRWVPNDTSGNHPSNRRTHQTHQSWEAPTVDHLEIV